ncbi:MAG: hypothetical protein HYZ75_16380 [Elusimicrobia bacterium]|nr:hypothetical protein [Elusimicrobiota bacterium]
MRPSRLLSRLLSAALAAVLGASPAVAEIDLDALFTGSVPRQDLVTAVFGGGMGMAGGARAAFGARLAPAAAQPVRREPPAPAAAISAEDLKRYIKLAAGDDGQFQRELLATLQTSPTGRRILKELIAEAKLAGVQVSVLPHRYEGSTIYVQNGTQRPNGTRGEMDTNTHTYTYNALFSEMNDRKLALEQAAGNAAHEFQHEVFSLRTQRLLVAKVPGYKAVIDSYDQLDEAWARPIGYMVGAELNGGRSTPYTEEGRDLANADDVDEFYEGMAMWGEYYATRLMPKDWADPIPAFQKRAETLQRKIADMMDTRENWVPARLSELDTLDRLAATPGKKYTHYKELKEQGAWDEIRSDVRARQVSLPTKIQQFETAFIKLRERLAFLRAGALPTGAKGHDPVAAGRLADMKRMAVDPAFLALKGQFERDVKAYQDYVDSHGLPAAAPPKGKWTFAQYYEFIKNDRAAYPDHWASNGG